MGTVWTRFVHETTSIFFTTTSTKNWCKSHKERSQGHLSERGKGRTLPHNHFHRAISRTGQSHCMTAFLRCMNTIPTAVREVTFTQEAGVPRAQSTRVQTRNRITIHTCTCSLRAYFQSFSTPTLRQLFPYMEVVIYSHTLAVACEMVCVHTSTSKVSSKLAS